MTTRRWTSRWSTTVLAGILAIAISGFVLAGSETDQGAESWPFGVSEPGKPSAAQRLKEIHERAIAALAESPEPADRDAIERVLRASFTCASFDGVISVDESNPPPVPPAHAAGHAGAIQKVEAAWQALNSPPDEEHPAPWPNWASCAGELEHGHGE